MTKLFNYLSIIFCFGLIVSCEPAIADDGGLLFGVHPIEIDTTGGNNNTNLRTLKKIVETDSDGEVLTIDYTYASAKLVNVKAKSTDGEDTQYNLTYSNDILTKVDMITVDPGGTLVTSMDLTYANGKLSKASGKGMVGTTEAMENTSDYTYANGKLTAVKTILSIPGINTPISTLDAVFGYSGDNLSTWKLTTAATGIPPIVAELALSDYDTYKNPFSSLPEAFISFSTTYGLGSSTFGGLSKNNYRAVKATTMGVVQNYACTYIYNSDGYPTSGIKSNGEGTITFEYN